MKITNKLNLPAPLYAKITRGIRRPDEKEIRVSALIEPPLIRRLMIDKWDELEADASDYVWAVLGTAFHDGMLEVTDLNSLAEERVSVDIGGVRITGRPDLLLDDVVYDYKTTTIATIKHKSRMTKWEEQLNVYAFLFKSCGFDVNHLCIVALMRDWTRYTTGGYPSQVVCLKVPLWRHAITVDFLEKRIEAHKNCLECSPDERWRKPARFGVKIKKRKTWLWYNTKEEADKVEEMLRSHSETERTYKPPVDTRCALYCPVRSVCPAKIAENCQIDEK